MRLDQLLDEVIELLEANQGEQKFKNFGALQKHKFQMQKYEENPEEREIRSLMYKGTKGNSEAAKLGHKHRKNKDEINKRAAKSRSEWYKKHPENYAKFMEAIRKRDAKRQAKKAKLTKST